MEGLPPADIDAFNELLHAPFAQIAAYVETHDMSPIWDLIDPDFPDDAEAKGRGNDV